MSVTVAQQRMNWSGERPTMGAQDGGTATKREKKRWEQRGGGEGRELNDKGTRNTHDILVLFEY